MTRSRLIVLAMATLIVIGLVGLGAALLLPDRLKQPAS